LTDVWGLLRLLLFVLTHPVGTFRFIKAISTMTRVFTTDVYGQTASLYRRDDRENERRV
jgi:hypothetical protein